MLLELNATTIAFYTIVFLAIYMFVLYILVLLNEREKKNNEKNSLKGLPSVSIIVPAYNEQENIEKCIKSLLNLNYDGKKEIIVVDDGSKDSTANIVKNLAKKHEEIKLLRNKKNRGKVYCLNKAVKKASYNYVLIVDADSFPRKDSLTNLMLKMLNSNENTLAVTSNIVAYRPRTLIQKLQAIEYIISNTAFRHLLAYMKSYFVLPGPATLIKKQAFKKLGYFKEGFITEDLEFGFRMLFNGYAIKHCCNSVCETVVPKTFADFFKQRLRWFRGFWQVLFAYRDKIFSFRNVFASFFVMLNATIFLMAINLFLEANAYNIGNALKLLFESESPLQLLLSFEYIEALKEIAFALNNFLFIINEKTLFLLILVVFATVYLFKGLQESSITKKSLQEISIAFSFLLFLTFFWFIIALFLTLSLIAYLFPFLGKKLGW